MLENEKIVVRRNKGFLAPENVSITINGVGVRGFVVRRERKRWMEGWMERGIRTIHVE